MTKNQNNNIPQGKICNHIDPEVRVLFHKSVTSALQRIAPSEKDWAVAISDDDGTNYHLYFFHNDNGKGPCFMVVARVGTYDTEKKQMMPSDEDKVIVFKFKHVDDLLLCQPQQTLPS